MSVARNPIRFDIFNRMQLIEKVGTGIKRQFWCQARMKITGPRSAFRNDVQTHCMRLFFEIRNMIETNAIRNPIKPWPGTGKITAQALSVSGQKKFFGRMIG